MKRLLLMAFIGWLGCLSCGGPPPKPGCAPGSGTSLAAECRAAIAVGDATLADCDALIDKWEAGCLR